MPAMPMTPAMITSRATDGRPVCTPNRTIAVSSRLEPDDQSGPRGEPSCADHRPQHRDPTCRVGPALALRLVGLPPQHDDAGQRDDHRPEHQRARPQQVTDGDDAESDRAERDDGAEVLDPRRPSRALAQSGRRVESRCTFRLLGVHRQVEPEAGVQQDAEAAEGGGDEEEDPHIVDRQREVLRDARCHTAQQPVVGAAVRPAWRHVGRRVVEAGLCHDPSIVTERVGPNHE